MVVIPEQLQCLFASSVERRDDSYVIEIPRKEIEQGGISEGEQYRVAVVHQPNEIERNNSEGSTRIQHETPDENRTPPVEEGEVRKVSIETLGDRGDGIAKVERGYVIIVPETTPEDEVTVEIENVRNNVAFAQVVNEDVDTPTETGTLNGLSAQPPPLDHDEQS